MKPEYLKLNYSEDGSSYIRKDHVEEIKKIDLIIYNYDSVLLDVRESNVCMHFFGKGAKLDIGEIKR